MTKFAKYEKTFGIEFFDSGQRDVHKSSYG